MTQLIFRRYFNIHPNDSVTSGNTVLLWARNCRETASDAKRRPPGRQPSFIEWPARSRDLNACNFFLWRYLKSKVYEKKPRKTVDLKRNITDEVATISPSMLQRVMKNFQKRLRECVDNNGRHLTDTIFGKVILKLKCFEIKIILVKIFT